ncbi:hypothetical protein CAI21_19445 [Alkalilimnicola ehrlichii]|uniref:Putative glucose-6-phosphate 1-epimerase n=1 Tax=Alkalilimnicola ehrlichii TaxID=351052 RepID=A0A3E0WJZ8_9GAMM|nr:D-hexose-6-phosphate mutarotase [Alkalilimnicola ehrlichii]RFA25294.1 hypothetical protein CAI21_19445 [Alkalilimnicola ehrlichii]RFA32407.1 hypothetical protein CAL65_19645 [Alkalilimnicola ehrlichii]
MIEFDRGAGGLPLIRMSAPQATATVCLQGAQVLACQLKGEELLWLSPNADYELGRAIRGGIPLCWPWFGAHPDQPGAPNHGYARTALWQVATTETSSTRTFLQLKLEQAGGPYAIPDCAATLSITLDEKLHLHLTTANRSKQPIRISQAFHTYLKVAQSDSVDIAALAGCRYLDKRHNMQPNIQRGPRIPPAPIDRIYLQPPSRVVIDDGSRRLRLESEGSGSTVVWNPGDEADALKDMSAEMAQHMLCVETANAAEDSRTVPPHGTHTLGMTLSQDIE